MATLPSINNINKEDIPDAPAWVESLINPLNTFMREVYYALDRDLTINENMIGAIRTISFTTRSDYLTAPVKEDGWVQQSITGPINVKPSIVALGKITDTATFKVTTSPTGIDWDYLNNDLRINYIAGLKPSTRYEVILLIF